MFLQQHSLSLKNDYNFVHPQVKKSVEVLCSNLVYPFFWFIDAVSFHLSSHAFVIPRIYHPTHLSSHAFVIPRICYPTHLSSHVFVIPLPTYGIRGLTFRAKAFVREKLIKWIKKPSEKNHVTENKPIRYEQQ